MTNKPKPPWPWPPKDGDDVYVDDGVKVGVDVRKEVDIEVDKDVDIDVMSDTWRKKDVKEEVSKWVNKKVDTNYDIDVKFDKKIDGPVTLIENSEIITNLDEDGNDVDNSGLINVSWWADLVMDDFNLDNVVSNWSFNGGGNDGLIDAKQSNTSVQDNFIDWPYVNYNGPTTGDYPWQSVYVTGGDATSNDGINGDVKSDGSASYNDGDGTIEGISLASAEINIDVSAFTQDLALGGNQQFNIYNLDLVGGNSVDISDSTIKAGGNGYDPKTPPKKDPPDYEPPEPPKPHEAEDASLVDIQDSEIIKVTDNDGNDFDNDYLINVGPDAAIWMDDFNLNNTGYNGSFNGAGNDYQVNIDQSNDLKSNNYVLYPTVTYTGAAPMGSPFQYVDLWGGTANSDDGIDGNVGGWNNASGNDGDGTIEGSTTATVDINTGIEAFTQDIVTGANTQVNNASASAVGGNSLTAEGVYGDPAQVAGSAPTSGGGGAKDGGDPWIGDVAPGTVTDIYWSEIVRDSDDDGNDVDTSSAINVHDAAWLDMDDMDIDNVAINDSFNGAGNDMGFDIDQVNDLVNHNEIYSPVVQYDPMDMRVYDPFQDVVIQGGWATAEDGISGNVEGGGNASNNGGDGTISGNATASADINATVEAFTQNIVMGANVQANVANLSVVGGDSISYDDVDMS